LGPAPPTHRPPLQASLVVQALSSLQGSVLLPWRQPVVGSQLSSVQTLLSLQLSAGPPAQLPWLQVSLVVQAMPSVQGGVLLVWGQPVDGGQLSSVQRLPSSQLGPGPPMHCPPLQVSLVVQALPSLQATWLAVWTQPLAGSQLSSVQGLPSSHEIGV